MGTITVAMACLLAQSASAAPAMPTIVMESNVGERPANMDEVIKPLLVALEGYGFVVKPQTILSLLGPRAPRPGVRDKGTTAAAIAQQIVTGLDAFRGARYQEAEDALTIAVRLIKRNPGVWATAGSNTSLTYTAFVKLSVAQAINGHVIESVATMMDVLRMSSTPFSKADYGPRAADIFKGAQKLAQSMGRGSLVVHVNDEHAVLFVDGTFRGIGKIAIGDMLPGSRQLFVLVGTEGRQWDLTVNPNDESVLDIDWRIASVLLMDEPSVGFAFGNRTELEKEGAYARQLAREWGIEKVIVVGLTRDEGNLEVLGAVYPANGAAARRASVAVSEGEEGMRSLARFLFDGTVSGKLNVLARGPGMYPQSATEDRRGDLSLTSKVVLGAGALAVGGGIATYVLSKPDDHTMPVYVDHKTPAVEVTVASSPVLGAGIYLGLRDTTSASRLESALLGAGSASIVAGSVMYLTAESPTATTGYVRQYYRNTATSGLVIGGTGVVLSGLGAWLWYRDSNRAPVKSSDSADREAPLTSLTPTISAGPSHVFLSCAGTF